MSYVPRRFLAFALAMPLLVSLPLAGRAADPFEINVIISMTGSAAFLGKDQAQAFQAIEDSVNKTGGVRGRPIKFVIADDQSNPQVGVQLLNQVIAQKAQIVIGSSIVAVCGAMAPLVANGPVLYCLSPGFHPADGSYGFSSEPSTTDAFTGTARYFSRKGWKKVALITSNDATGQDATKGIDAAFQAQGGVQLVARETFNPTDQSVSAQMARIKATNPDAIIAWATGTPIATVLRGISDIGIDVPTMIGNGNMSLVQMKSYTDIMPKLLLFPGYPAMVPNQLPAGTQLKSAAQAFNASVEAAGSKVEAGHVSAWDPAVLVVNAYRKLGFDATAAQLRDYLASTRGWVGADGTYDFRAIPQRGVGAANIVITRWDPVHQTWEGVSKLGGDPL